MQAPTQEKTPADAYYKKAITLESQYKTELQNFSEAKEKYKKECRDTDDCNSYGYFGAGGTKPNKEPSNQAKKLAESTKEKYIATLREAAEYGSKEAINELIQNNLPLKEPELPQCLVM